MNLKTELTFKDTCVTIHRSEPTVIIGERINPTGRKVVLQALQEGNFEMVRQDADAQGEADAKVRAVTRPGGDRSGVVSGAGVIQKVDS
jgi:cobalamin-dependent methionine synthase I